MLINPEECSKTSGGVPPRIVSPPPVIPPQNPTADKGSLDRRKPRNIPGLARRVLVLVGILLVAGVGIRVGFKIWNEVTRKDSKADFVFLAQNLFEDLPVAGVPSVKFSDAEVEVKLQELREGLLHRSHHCRSLAPIADNYLVLFSHAQDITTNAPKGSRIAFGLLEAALGVYTSQRDQVAEGGKKALQETEKGWDAVKAAENLFQEKHVLAVKLAEITPQFCSTTMRSNALTWSFAEHTPGFLELQKKDYLNLTNSSGKECHNCIVSARFSDAAGNSYVDFYFISDWRADEARMAQFSDFDCPKLIVDNPLRIEVAMWCEEFVVAPSTLMKPLSGWPEPN
jgi:hypothetical protein